MAIENGTELKLRVTALLRDTGPLHTAAGIAFAVPSSPGSLKSSSPKLVDECARAITSETTSWRALDLRTTSNDDAITQLADATRAPGSVVLMLNDHGPLPALLLAQALANKKRTVDLGDLVQRTLPDDISLVVVVPGVGAHEDLPRQLQAVDYWEIIHAD